jgi:hypothetical protein
LQLGRSPSTYDFLEIPAVYSQNHHVQPPTSIEQTAADAHRRMESELAGLAAVERELDRLDRQLSELRERLVRNPPELA